MFGLDEEVDYYCEEFVDDVEDGEVCGGDCVMVGYVEEGDGEVKCVGEENRELYFE